MEQYNNNTYKLYKYTVFFLLKIIIIIQKIILTTQKIALFDKKYIFLNESENRFGKTLKHSFL